MSKKDEALNLALEALNLARAAHGQMLLSDPPQEAWKAWGVSAALTKTISAIREALAEQPAQQWNPNDHYKDGWRDGMLAAQQHDRVRELECVIADLKAECRELIAQQEQEPVARVNDDGFIVETGLLISPGELLYTSPPASKPWVGLTDEEKSDLWCESTGRDCVNEDTHVFADAIEAKLKEKNTGETK